MLNICFEQSHYFVDDEGFSIFLQMNVCFCAGCIMAKWYTDALNLLYLLLSTDSAKKAQLAEVRRKCKPIIRHIIFPVVIFFFLPTFSTLYLFADAVSIWGGPCSREEDRPQESRCLRRDDVQEGRLLLHHLDIMHRSTADTTPPCSFLCSPPPDRLLCSARGHPAEHWLHGGQPELQAWERCADAGLLHGGEHLLPQVLVLCRDWVIYVYLCHSVSYTRLSAGLPYSEGSNLTPAHHYPDFRFKTYAPVAFRYFRELFGIRPDDYLVSCHCFSTHDSVAWLVPHKRVFKDKEVFMFCVIVIIIIIIPVLEVAIQLLSSSRTAELNSCMFLLVIKLAKVIMRGRLSGSSLLFSRDSRSPLHINVFLHLTCP